MSDGSEALWCSCYCHVGGQTCTVDAGFSGIPGVTYCGPHTSGDGDEIEVVFLDPMPIEEACVYTHVPRVKKYLGLLCGRHYHQIGNVLDQIEELYALLPDVIEPGVGGDGRGSKAVHAPATLRLHVAALTDRRNKAMGDSDHPVFAGADGTTNPMHIDESIMDVPGRLLTLAERVADGRWVRKPKALPTKDLNTVQDALNGTVTSSLRLLRREQKWIANQPDCVEIQDDLDDIHRALAQGVGVSKFPQSMGQCPNCQAKLYNTIGVDQVSCRKCGSVWEGVHLARLKFILDRQHA